MEKKQVQNITPNDIWECVKPKKPTTSLGYKWKYRA